MDNYRTKLIIIFCIKTPSKLLSEMIFKADSSGLELCESIFILFDVCKQISKTGYQEVIARHNVYEEVFGNLLHLKHPDLIKLPHYSSLYLEMHVRDEVQEELGILEQGLPTATQHGHQLLPLAKTVIILPNQEAEE